MLSQSAILILTSSGAIGVALLLLFFPWSPPRTTKVLTQSFVEVDTETPQKQLEANLSRAHTLCVEQESARHWNGRDWPKPMSHDQDEQNSGEPISSGMHLVLE